MSFTCEPELVEELAYGRLDPTRTVELEAHIAGCAACRRELEWLRTERALAVRRAAAVPSVPDTLWRAVELRAHISDGAVAGMRHVSAPGARRYLVGLCVAAVALVGVGLSLRSYRNHRRDGHAHDDRHRSRFSYSASPTAEGDTLVAETAVAGPIMLRLASSSADVKVIPGAPLLVRVHARGVSARAINLVARGGAIEVLFDGGPARSGTVEVEVPATSSVDISSASGDVELGSVGGNAQVRTASGSVDVDGCGDLDVETASGGVAATGGKGRLVVKTVSGDIDLATQGPAAQVRCTTVSGDLEWRGGCGVGCDLSFHTVSGNGSLAFEGPSSFQVSYRSRSGDLTDELPLTEVIERRRGGPSGSAVRGRYASGDGRVDVESTSGDVTLEKD